MGEMETAGFVPDNRERNGALGAARDGGTADGVKGGRLSRTPLLACRLDRMTR
jgi:hypothetical protein